jgi:type III secretion system YscJ/HrcJ family lipoprotein
MKTIVLVLSFICLLLTGCEGVLYSNLQEKEANEMLALLNASGIKASIILEKGVASISVPTDKKAIAVDALYAYGYPKNYYDTVPKLFPADSLIKSPLEEQVRYNYAVAQGIAEMISAISGVLDVKAHIIMPFKEGRERSSQKSANDMSVSVMIKYSKFVDLKDKVQDITTLVVKSIPRILPNNVGIVLFEADTPHEQGLAYGSSGIVSAAGENQYYSLIIAIIIFVLLFTGVAVFFYINSRKNKDKSKTKEESKDADDTEAQADKDKAEEITETEEKPPE